MSRMALPLLLGAGALIARAPSGVPQSPGAEDPSRIVWLATRAVEGDSAPRVLTRWQQRLKRNSADRAALLGVATLARLAYDYAAADSTYTRLLGLQPFDVYTAHAAMGLGYSYRVRGQWREAQTAFERALREADASNDARGRAEAMIQLATTRFRTAGVAAAESLLAGGDSVVPAGDARLRALLLCSRAAVVTFAGRAGSRALAEEGAAAAGRAGEPRLEALCRHIVGQEHWRRGWMDSAGAAWETTAAIQRRSRDRAGLAVTLQWYGAALASVGNYGQARQTLQEAIAAGGRSGSLTSVAWAYLNLASIHMQVGDLPYGAELAGRATALLREQGDQLGLAQARALEAQAAAARGDLAAARETYAELLVLNQRLGRTPGVLAAHNALRDIAIAQRNWTAAAEELAQAHRLVREQGMTAWEQGLTREDALLALRRGDLAPAESLLWVALSRPEQPVRRYRDWLALAEVHARQGRLAAADSELTAAAGSLDRWRASLDARDFRLFAFQIQEALDPDLGWATVIARLAANGRERSAFALSERRRARELLDAMGRADALRPQPATANARLDAARRAELGITAQAVAEGLPDERTALIHYATGRGGEATTAFVITSRGLSAHILPPVDSMSDDVARFVALVEAGTPAPGLSRTLGESLLGPVVAGLPSGISRLILVPDDVLHRVPFDLLTVQGRPVVEQFAVSLMPSAAVALRLWARPPGAGPKRLLAMADPRFPAPEDTDGQPAAAYRSLFAENGGLPRLAASATEAKRVARYVPEADVRLRDQASEAFLKHTSLSPYRILHFATHAFVDERSPVRTVLVLARGEGEDGFVDTGDLAALTLDADLVVLSACRTARGVVIRGEGVQGLTAPLLEAGARSVLATTWAVGDRAAARFVEGFYRRLAAGVAVGDALRETKLEELRAGRPVNQWAAFTLVGDPLVRTATAPAR